MNNLQTKGTGESNVPINERAEVKNWEDNQPLCLGGAGASLAVLLVVVQVGGSSPNVFHHIAAWFGAAAIPIWLAMWILSDTNAFWSAKGIENTSKRPWYLRSGFLFVLAFCCLVFSILILLCASFPLAAGICLIVGLICGVLVVSHSFTISATTRSKKVIPMSNDGGLAENISEQNINNDDKTESSDSGRSLEIWFFYRSRYAGCAAFTFALFLAISQIKSEACSWGRFLQEFPGCDLRYAMFAAVYSACLWFALHIAATTYEQLGRESLKYLTKRPFKILWSTILACTVLGSFVSALLFVRHFSYNAALGFGFLFAAACFLVLLHEWRVRKFIKKPDNPTSN